MLMKKLAMLSGLLAVVLLMGACKRNSDESKESPKVDPSPLFRPAMSTWNFEKTRRELGYNSWDTLEDRQPLVSDKRPPFRIVVIRVPDFKDHGFNGSLVLQFYNDRLMKTQFYVGDMKGYLRAAAASQQVSLGNDSSGHIPPHTRVWVGKEEDGREYLGMEDEILLQQMKDWIGRYSAG
jgi:hypothetical protein